LRRFIAVQIFMVVSPAGQVSSAPASPEVRIMRPTPQFGFLALPLLRQGLTVMLDMVFGGLISVANGLLRVAMRDERLMRCMGVVFLRVIPRGFAMMPRRLLVMARCGLVVLGSAKNLAHEVLQFWQLWARVGLASLSGHGPVPANVEDKVRNEDRVRFRQRQPNESNGMLSLVTASLG
jgi:hypothetical protein